MTGTRSIILHGHFYQPPREDPWLEEVPRQPAAAPWHDWNERIERECYRAVVAARVLDGDGKIERVVNTLAWLSFDVGPTLFEWMEHAAPSTYAAILDADRASVARLGHGNAVAQPYHHVILPLLSRRDKLTEVRWGMADFRRRYGRDPEGMWCPEAAVDDETLDVLAQEGIRFTIVGPTQVTSAPPHGRMGRYTTNQGRRIALGIYDGDRSHGVAFGRLLTNARVWKSDLLKGHEGLAHDDVVSIATDGETFGHHHPFSEMALAWLVHELSHTERVRVTNFASLLARSRALPDVQVVTPSSWSCSHGVDRWRADCGCRAAAEHPPRQAWRAPLRTGLVELQAQLDGVFESEGTRYFADPWKARDAYGAVVGADAAVRDARVEELLRPKLTARQKVRARELLELARDSLRMFTSCAWFFDDIDGLELAQNLRYAARAIQLAGPAASAMEEGLTGWLREAHGAADPTATAEQVWVNQVRPPLPPLVRLAAGLAASAATVPGWAPRGTPAFEVAIEGERVRLTSRRTGRHLLFDVRVSARGVADLQAFVVPRPDLDDDLGDGTPPLAGTVPVWLADFPEREAEAVRDAIRLPRRRELARRLLGDETLLRVALGDTTLVDATVAALLALMEGLADDPSPVRAERGGELADLLELLGHHVPFDAQTRFARALEGLDGTSRALVAGLGSRLGFSPSVLASDRTGD